MTATPRIHQLSWRATVAGWFDAARRDVTLSARSLQRSPGVPLAIIATLTLGLGANAAVFSFLDQVFMRMPAGVSEAHQLRRVWIQHPAGATARLFTSSKLSYHHYRAITRAIRDQATLALYATQPNIRIGQDDSPSMATVTYATASYFDALGVHPARGRWFTESEADVNAPARVAVVSDAMWRKHLGADSAMIGSTLLVERKSYVVIGVAPPRFSGVDLEATDIWLPLGAFPTHEVPRVSFWESSLIFFSVFARVPSTINELLLEERATVAYRRSPTTDFPPSDEGRIFFRSIIDARGIGDRPHEVSIALRLGIVAIVILLMTVANVVNLLVARSISRHHEVGIRLALGISRGRLMRLFFIEAALLSLIAAAGAILCAQVAGNGLRRLLAPDVHFGGGVVRWSLVTFTAILALITSIAIGLGPALQARRLDVTILLKADSRDAFGRSWLQQLLVGVQTALSVTLIVGAALFVRSLRNVETLHTGFDVPRLAYASVVFPGGPREDTAALVTGMRAVRERLRRVPSVEVIAFARDEPMTWFGRVKFYTETDSSESLGKNLPTMSYVSSDFFKALGTSFTRGATFADDSPPSVNAVVVNEALAHAFWPNQNPVGRCIYLQRRDSACLTIVGVVENAIRQRIVEEPTPQLYISIFQPMRGARPPRVMVIRADPDRLGLVMARASRALLEAFPGSRAEVVRMADRLAPQYRPWKLGAALFSSFGVLALAVAALGIYSSVSYMVAQRRHEMGVRIALGAESRDVILHVVGAGLRPVVLGGVAGAVVAVATAKVIDSLLYGIQARNPGTIIAAFLTLLAVGMAAAWLPAWRATRIDPVRVLETR
jgi:predicted permease